MHKNMFHTLSDKKNGLRKYSTKLYFSLFLHFMSPSNVFRQSSLADIDGIALFKNIILPKSSLTRNIVRY